MIRNSLTYKDAGVDIERGNELVRRIAPLAARTRRDGVRAGVGGFGALFEIPIDRYPRPLLVSGTDGVGTKLRLAIDTERLDGVGIDLVAMCVNDVLTLGAEPLYFLDYYATGKLDVDQAERVIAGIARGCDLAGAALIGGETAEMPGMYAPGDLDLAGFCVGVVNADAVVDAATAEAGDVVIGLASDGPHSNGYSLIRHLLGDGAEQGPTGWAAALSDIQIDGVPLVERLLAPTRIYARAVRAMLETLRPRAMAHITGGGLLENAQRGLREDLQVSLDSSCWPRSAVFDWIEATGGVSRHEMLRTFNCGIGYLVMVRAEDQAGALQCLAAAGETAYVIGELVPRAAGAPAVQVA